MHEDTGKHVLLLERSNAGVDERQGVEHHLVALDDEIALRLALEQRDGRRMGMTDRGEEGLLEPGDATSFCTALWTRFSNARTTGPTMTFAFGGRTLAIFGAGSTTLTTSAET